MVRQLISSPETFMERKVGQPKLAREILTVLVIGALGAIGSALVGQQIVDAASTESIRFPVIGAVLEPIVGAVVIWVGYALALHVAANRFGGRGPISRLLKTTAWAMIPIGLGNLVRSVTTYLAFQNVDIAAVLAETNRDPVPAVMAEGTSEPLYVAGTLVLAATVLWTGYLLVFAVQNAKNVSHEDARKAVVVPVAVHVLFILWNLV